MKYYLYLIVTIFVISCDDSNIKKEYYTTGELRQEIDLRTGLTKVYDVNKKVTAKGYILDNTEIGIWEYYSNKGGLDSIVDYRCYNGEIFPESIYILNKKGDTIGGHYYKIRHKDTITLGEKLRVYMLLKEPLYPKKRKHIYALIPQVNSENSDNLDSCLVNTSKFVYDTVLSLADRFKTKRMYEDKSRHVLFDYEIFESGKQELRCILMEEYKSTNTKYKYMGYQFFVKIPFYVKDTIK